MRLSFHKQFSVGFLMGECSRSMQWVCGVASVPKCDFNKAATQSCWDDTSAWVFSCEFAVYFHGTFFWSFAKVLLSLIARFNSTFTYCSQCFVHDSQIITISQLLLIICNSSYICVSCVHNLKLCYFFDNRVWSKQALFLSFRVNDFKKPLKQ